MSGSQDHGAYANRGDLGLRVRQAHSDGCPSVKEAKQVSGLGRELQLWPCHSTMMPCFCGVLGFFHKLSSLWSSLLLSSQGVFSQPTAVPDTKILAPCAPMPNRNKRQRFVRREERDDFTLLQGTGQNTAG